MTNHVLLYLACEQMVIEVRQVQRTTQEWIVHNGETKHGPRTNYVDELNISWWKIFVLELDGSWWKILH